MEEQLGWSHKLGEMESLGISIAGPTVSTRTRLMESQIWQKPAGSVALCGESSEKEQWLLPAFLSGRKLSTSSRLDARYFSFSL